MENFTASFTEIKKDFSNNAIPTDAPGFYDHPNFMALEKLDADYLNNYASFVQKKEYSNEYLNRARREVPVIIKALLQELLEDGRKGACVDMSGVLSKVLEKEGFWNFVIKGSLTIIFPQNSGLGKNYFWSVDHGEFTAGHAWVFAPPFGIIDLTICQQYGDDEHQKYLPDYVVSQDARASKPTVEDIISPEVRILLQQHGIREHQQLDHVNPLLKPFLNTFKTFSVKHKNTDLKYVPVAISAPDCGLDKLIGISQEGKSGLEIYQQAIIPRLMEFRA